jgi:hypothetical protein
VLIVDEPEGDGFLWSLLLMGVLCGVIDFTSL